MPVNIADAVGSGNADRPHPASLGGFDRLQRLDGGVNAPNAFGGSQQRQDGIDCRRCGLMIGGGFLARLVPGLAAFLPDRCDSRLRFLDPTAIVVGFRSPDNCPTFRTGLLSLSGPDGFGLGFGLGFGCRRILDDLDCGNPGLSFGFLSWHRRAFRLGLLGEN